MQVKTVKISELRPHPKNPRVHPDSAIEKLERSIKEYGPKGNKKRVDTICRELAERDDILPISPLHLFSFMENDDNREEILQVCFRLIDVCDEVWIYGDSEGCKKEREYALSRGKKVLKKRGD